MSASMLNITLDGLTGEAKWTEDGECDKAPKAYVIKDGVTLLWSNYKNRGHCAGHTAGFNHFPDCAGMAVSKGETVTCGSVSFFAITEMIVVSV